MAPTVVTLCGISSSGKEYENSDNSRFHLKSYENDTLSIKASYGTIEDFCKLVAGCFEKGSTFYGVKTVKLNFNGVKIYVSKSDATPEKIHKKWLNAYKELHK